MVSGVKSGKWDTSRDGVVGAVERRWSGLRWWGGLWLTEGWSVGVGYVGMLGGRWLVE